MIPLVPSTSSTRRRNLRGNAETPPPSSTSVPGAGVSTAMRLIVPLQGVVQGRGGLVLGTLIPCALSYALQLYFKNRPSSSSSSSSGSQPSPESESGGIQRTLSRSILSSRSPVAVSARAVALAKSDSSPYFVGAKKCAEDLYHPMENPNGVIQLGLAENQQLSLDLLQDWMSCKLKDLASDEQNGRLTVGTLAGYQPFDGLMELKMDLQHVTFGWTAEDPSLQYRIQYASVSDIDCNGVFYVGRICLQIGKSSQNKITILEVLLKNEKAMAGYMGQVMNGTTSFDPSRIVLTAGATPAIETLSFCLADPGNAFLVPSPYCTGYDRNIRWRSGVKIIPVPCRSTDNFSLSISTLERAYNQAKKKGIKVRAVLLSNPTNPVGNLLPRETLHEFLDFAIVKNIHVISDEVFAGSTYGNEEFVSISEVLNTHDSDRSRVHIVYDLSKDLSLPGFRVGLIYSYNEHVLAAATKLARFSSVSVMTQRVVVTMLADSRFITEYVKINRERLCRMYGLLVDGLKQLGIECAKSSGGFYCWADMSKFMRSYSQKGELELWLKMLNVAKINTTPGTACHCIEPGWFRLCFTTITEKDMPVVIERIKRAINSH